MKQSSLYYLAISFIILFVSGCSEDSSGEFYLSYADDNGRYIQGDKYNEIVENPFVSVEEEPVSTFSIDADGGSYSNLRRFILDDQQLPPANSVRTEELINYFMLDYPYTSTDHPISLNGEISSCPWSEGHRLIRIGIKGKPLETDQDKGSNFTFLIDVSGSMSSEDKLELLKNGFKLLVNDLTADDRVAIITYAGSSGIVLNSTPGDEKDKIKSAIDKLGAGGGTNGADGIITAYEIAESNFIEGGNNRVILGTDGDFNVGISSQDELIELIEEKRDKGVFLTAIGVGRGNLNDASLEQIANHGNGTYEYIDHIEQLRKVFIYEKSKLFTVAKDVKVQVEFNPGLVASYRLIGYENRVLNTEDFEDDKEDAGELGANQNVTALYEIVPAAGSSDLRHIPAFTINFRYKLPDQDASVPLDLKVFDEGYSFGQSSDFMKFTAAVASFGLQIRGSSYAGDASYQDVLNWVNATNLKDEHGFKDEFKSVVNRAKDL